MARWRGKLHPVCRILVVVTAAAALVSCGPGRDSLGLKIATLDAGSSWYLYGATFAELIRKELPQGSRIDVLPFSGSIGNPKLVARGEVDLALCMGVTANWAYHGKFTFDEAHEDLRALVGGLDRYYYAAIARRELNLSSIGEIREKKTALRLITQAPGTLNALMCFQVLAAYQITPEEIRQYGGEIIQTSTDVIAAEMKDGRADLWFQPVTPGHPSVMEVATSIRIKFLPFEPEIIRRLVETYGYAPATLPAGSFTGQDEAVPMAGYSTCLISSTRLPESVAYAVTQAVCEGERHLKAVYRGMESFHPETAWDPGITGLPLHPGAERYYREKGYMR